MSEQPRLKLKAQRSKTTEAQIVFALRQAESGTPIAEIIRKIEISEITFYRWKKKYAGMGVSELRRLKRLVADLTLDKQMLQDALSKKF